MHRARKLLYHAICKLRISCYIRVNLVLLFIDTGRVDIDRLLAQFPNSTQLETSFSYYCVLAANVKKMCA